MFLPGVATRSHSSTWVATPLHVWDEHQPSPYVVDITLHARIDGRELTHTVTTPLAMREIATRGTQITVNGRPIFCAAQ